MSDETVTLRHDGPSARFRMLSQDIDVGIGETFDVPIDETLSLVPVENTDPSPGTGEEITVTLPEFLQEHTPAEFTVVTGPFDVLDESVDDLIDALESGEYDGKLDALAHAERSRENRKTALEAINARRDDGED